MTTARGFGRPLSLSPSLASPGVEHCTRRRGLKRVCLLDLESATVRALSTLLGRDFYVLVAEFVHDFLSVLDFQVRLDALVVGMKTQDIEKLKLGEAMEAERPDVFLSFLCAPDIYIFLRRTSNLKVQRFFRDPFDILKLAESIHEELDPLREQPRACFMTVRWRAVARAIKYIEENVVSIKHASDVSRYVGVSREYLSREFTRCTGYTLWDFVNSSRVERAKEQLRSGQFLIKQISSEVGFDSLSTFYKVFKRYVAVSPGQYRKSLAQR